MAGGGPRSTAWDQGSRFRSKPCHPFPEVGPVTPRSSGFSVGER